MRIIIPILCFIAMVGCTRLPEKLYQPTAVFKAEIQDNVTVYTMYVKGIILNEHTERFLKDIRGSIILRNGDVELITIPFEVPALLPLQKFTVNAEKSGTDRDMAAVLSFFRISPDQLAVSDGVAYTHENPIPPSSVEMKIISYETGNIMDIIKGN